MPWTKWLVSLPAVLCVFSPWKKKKGLFYKIKLLDVCQAPSNCEDLYHSFVDLAVLNDSRWSQQARRFLLLLATRITNHLARTARWPWDSCTQQSPPVAWSACPPGPGTPSPDPWRTPRAPQTWARSGNQLQPTGAPCGAAGQTAPRWGWTARSSSVSAGPPEDLVVSQSVTPPPSTL